MPDPQRQSAQKLVHVANLGVVAFPWAMPDEGIVAAIRALKGQGTKRQGPGTPPASLAALRMRARARFGGLTTEESEHRRLMGNVPEVTPDWNTARQAVYKATEPTLPNPNVKPADSSWGANRDAAWNAGVNTLNVGGNVLKRAGRFVFGIVDMPPQVYGIVSRLYSPDKKVSQQAEGELLELHPGAQIADRLKEGIQDWRKSKSLAAENVVGDLLGLFLLSKAGKILPEARIQQLEAEGVVLPPEAKPKAPVELSKTPAQAPTIEGQFRAAGLSQPVQVEPVEAAAKLTKNEPPKLPEAEAPAEAVQSSDAAVTPEIAPKPLEAKVEAEPIQAGEKPSSVDAQAKLIYKPEPATQPQIADAWRQLGDIRLELEKHPPPKDPDPARATPDEMEKWKADYKAWAEKSQPWFEKYRQAAQQIEDLNNREIGQIRQLPDGKTVLYLNRDGLNGLYHAMHGGPRPEYTLSGVALSPEDAKAVMRNLAILKPPLHQQLREMIRRSMDKNGVTISMIPQKGQSMREALATLREELNHGWQKNFADAAGNHLPAAQFKELNAAIPQPMASYIDRNYPEIVNDGSELRNKARVLEAAAKMLSEPPVTFGLTEDEATAYLFQYFHAVEEAHGAKALDELVHITVLAKEIKHDYFNATERAAGGEEGAGSVRGVQEGRVQRAEGASPAAERGTPAGAATGTTASLKESKSAPLKKQTAAPQPSSAPEIESVKPEPVAPKSAGGAAVVPQTMRKEARSPAQIKSLLALRREAERLRAQTRSATVVK